MTRQRWAYLASLLLALIVRSIFVATADGESLFTRWSTANDAGVYDQFGWNLVREGTFGVDSRPSAFSLPAYPLLLAGTYRIAGHKPGAVRWVQVVLGVCTVVFLGRLARCLGGGRAELLTVAAGAVYPFFIYFTGELLTESLFLFALSGALLTAARLGSRGRVADGALHGVFAGLLVMTRPAGFFLEPGVLILTRPWAREKRGRRTVALLLAAVIVALVWGAWIARNRRVFGEPVLLDTHGGWGLYTGQMLSRRFTEEEIFRRVRYSHRNIQEGTLPGGPRGELEEDRRCGREAIEMIRSDPAAFLATLPRNVADLWVSVKLREVVARGGGPVPLRVATWVSYFPVLVLGIAGLVRLRRARRWPPLAAALAILLLSTALHAGVRGGKRYRAATLDPVLLVLAAWEVDCRIRAARSRGLHKEHR